MAVSGQQRERRPTNSPSLSESLSPVSPSGSIGGLTFSVFSYLLVWFYLSSTSCVGFPGGLVGKESEGDRVQSLGWEDPLETEAATYSSILA